MQHRGANKSQPVGKIIPGYLAKYAAGIERHGIGRNREMQARQCTTRNQGEHKTTPADQQHLIADLGAQITRFDQDDTVINQHGRNQKGEKTEQVKAEIGDPGARSATEVADFNVAATVRPRRVEHIITGHRDQEVTRQRKRQQHAGLAQTLIDLRGNYQPVFVGIAPGFRFCLCQ